MSIILLIRKNPFLVSLLSGFGLTSGKKRNLNKRGFTLIETVMAIVILSIAVIGVVRVFFTGLTPKNAPMSIEITTGTQLVQEGVERIKAQRAIHGFANISLGSTTDTITGSLSSYSRQINVTTWGSTNYKQVTVTVTHSGRTVASATTLLANY